MADKQKPLIILINPEENSRKYWRESLDTYLKSQGVEADIREEGSMLSFKRSNVIIAFDLMGNVIKEGKRPALLITDAVLGQGDFGGQIVGALRRGDALGNQDQIWPEGKDLPAVIASGAILGVSDPEKGHPNTLTCSCVCLHDELNDPHYNGPGKPVIEEFKKFVNQALGLPPPQIIESSTRSQREKPTGTWQEHADLPPKWRRRGFDGD